MQVSLQDMNIILALHEFISNELINECHIYNVREREGFVASFINELIPIHPLAPSSFCSLHNFSFLIGYHSMAKFILWLFVVIQTNVGMQLRAYLCVIQSSHDKDFTAIAE